MLLNKILQTLVHSSSTQFSQNLSQLWHQLKMHSPTKITILYNQHSYSLQALLQTVLGLKILAVKDTRTQQLHSLQQPLDQQSCYQIVQISSQPAKQVVKYSSSFALCSLLQQLFKVLLIRYEQKEENSFTLQIQGFGIQQIKLIKQDLEQRFSKLIHQKHPFEIKSVTLNQLNTIFSQSLTNLETQPQRFVAKIKQFVHLVQNQQLLAPDTSFLFPLEILSIQFPNKNRCLITATCKEHQSTHQKIGYDLRLFGFHKWSQGNTFFFPHGYRIYNSLKELLQKQYRHRGYQQIQTPILFNQELWNLSGHSQKYRNHMYFLTDNQDKIGLKPMNCPGHCLMFKMYQRSYKELPIRFAEFSALHRRQKKGCLVGLTRLNTFVQDDAHIFCTSQQIEQQILSNLNFMDQIYNALGFEYKLQLSTKPQLFIGQQQQWNSAQKQLIAALQKLHKQFEINQADGAFYGPKIDAKIQDSKGKEHQCGTIQLDFQGSRLFNLQYRTKQISKETNLQLKKGFKRPVIIHRAIIGSFQRMIGLLIEHYQGKLPFWLNPRQLRLIPLRNEYNEFCERLKRFLSKHNFWVDIDSSEQVLGRKISRANRQCVFFYCIIGKEQLESGKLKLKNEQYGLNELVVYLKSLYPKTSAQQLNLQQFK